MAEIVQKIQAVTGSFIPVKVGDKIATGVMLKEHSFTDANVSLDNLPGKNLIVGVPGAFSSTCSTQVPGYIKNLDTFLSKGVQGIYVVSVNDQFVMEAWKEKLGGAEQPKIHFIADDQAKFTSAIGLSFNATAFMGNIRAKRYVLLVEDGIVKDIQIDEDVSQVVNTKADNLLAKF